MRNLAPPRPRLVLGIDPGTNVTGYGVVAHDGRTPTLIECGVADYDITVWIGVLAPAGTPKSVLERLQCASAEVLAEQHLRRALGEMGAVVPDLTPQEFADFIEVEAGKWARVVARTGVRAARPRA